MEHFYLRLPSPLSYDGSQDRAWLIVRPQACYYLITHQSGADLDFFEVNNDRVSQKIMQDVMQGAAGLTNIN